MLHVLTPGQMRAAEQRAFERGVSSLLVMENAARQLVDRLSAMLGGARGRRAVFVCGQGNNGGDGLAMARLFHQRGGLATVCLLGEASTPDAGSNLRYARALGIPFIDDIEDLPAQDAAVDALFGIGLSRAPEGRAAALIKAINGLGVPVLSVDLPSGFDALSGQVYDPCVRADVTATMGWPKLGLCLTQRPELVGRLEVCDIGLPPGCLEEGLPTILEAGDLRGQLPRRSPAAHKGSNGRVLIYAGSAGMAGAAAMAALACLKAGAGLVTIACDRISLPVLQTLVPGATCRDAGHLLDQIPAHDVLLAGCGLEENEANWQILRQLMTLGRPAVLDAGALSVLAARPMNLGMDRVITPHIGEAARLLKQEVAALLRDPMGSAEALQRAFGCTVLMKSHVSIIRDAQQTALNTVGSPALAKGGSGDALGGIVAGLMAQGLPPFQAARTGSLWLGKAGRLAEKRCGLYSALTTQVIELMHEAIDD